LLNAIVLSSIIMKRSPLKFILFLLLAGALTFLIFRPFAYVLAIALIVTLAIVGLLYIGKFVAKAFRKFKIRNTIEGIVEDKVALVEKQVTKHEGDLSTIQVEIADIDVKLQQTGLSSSATDKLIRLREAFLVEEELKKEKVAFYLQIIKKFDQLLTDQEISRNISSKKAKLNEVRNESDVPEEETLQLSTNKEIIEEMDYLTLRMDNVVHIDEAREIQKELITL